MPSRRSLAAALRYLIPPLLAGIALAAARRRSAIPVLAAAAAVLPFHRDPERPLAARPGVVYAPTDGIVIAAGTGPGPPWLPAGSYLHVSAFLALHHVHVARSPAAGPLLSWSWAGTRHRAALDPRAARDNRQARITIGDGAGVIGLVLAAGALARRITAWAPAGQDLACGDRIALIHFGSRCDMWLPGRPVYEPLVRRGARLAAGQTPVARRRVLVPGPRAGC